jgi:hypothetical protein
VHYWDLDVLKRALAAEAVPPADRSRYLVSVATANVLGVALPALSPSLATPLDAGVGLVAFALGTWLAFAANGGRAGRDFLGRYPALWCVFGARFSVFVGLPVVLSAGVVAFALGLPPVATSAVVAFLNVAFYAALAAQLRALEVPTGGDLT